VAPPKPDMMIFYFCQALLQILLSGAFRIGNSSVLSHEQMEKKKKNDMNEIRIYTLSLIARVWVNLLHLSSLYIIIM
jgi:hypothetical protein